MKKYRQKERRKTKTKRRESNFFSLVSLYHIRPHRSVKQKNKKKKERKMTPKSISFSLKKKFFFFS